MFTMLDTLFNINTIMYTFPIAGWGVDTYAMSYLEFWVSLLNLGSVIAFRKNHISAYPLSIIACAGLAVMFYQINLYSDQLLNIYFIVISIFGWIWWKKKKDDGSELFSIRYMNKASQLRMIVASVISIVLLGTFIDPIFSSLATLVATILGESYTHTNAALPYWDATTTVLSVFAMYLLTRRYVESWILWVIVNVISVGLYYYRGVLFLSLEYIIFLANAIYAWYLWHKESLSYSSNLNTCDSVTRS